MKDKRNKQKNPTSKTLLRFKNYTRKDYFSTLMVTIVLPPKFSIAFVLSYDASYPKRHDRRFLEPI